MSRKSSEPDFSLIMLIVIGGTIWAHPVGMLKIAHIALIVSVVTAVLVALTWLVRLIKRFRRWRQSLNINMDAIDAMTGLEFERCVADLLRSRGYENIRLTEQYDLGVDIIADKDDTRWGIQVKRYNGLVGADAVRQVVSALRSYQCDMAMVVTNSVYSRPAEQLARDNNCVLIDRNEVITWIA